MPTTAQAKKAWEHGRKSQDHYNALTGEQKSAMWQYGRDNGLVDRNNLDDYKRSEFDTYVKSDFTRYEPTISNADMPEALKADKYANYQGPKVPLNKQYTAPQIAPTPTSPKPLPKMTPAQKKVYADELRITPTIGRTNIAIPDKPKGNKIIPVGKAGIIKTQAPSSGGFGLLKGLGAGAMAVVDAVDNAFQAPATIAVRAGEGVDRAIASGNNGFVGALKGIGTGVKDVLTGQNRVYNTELIETVAPKTTAELKAKYPQAYNVASTLADFVGVDDMIGLGIISDIAKVNRLNNIPTSTKALNDLFGKIKTNAPLTVAEQAIIKENPEFETIIKSQGNYKVKNTALPKAENEYNEAIETIQNKFKASELRTDEALRIKPELGIDLDQLVKNMEDAQQVDVSAIGRRRNMANVAGVKSLPNIKNPRIEPRLNTSQVPISTPKPLSNINTRPIVDNGSKVKLGEATWKNKDYDAPVEVVGDFGEINGRKYVKIKGSNTGVPLDEIVYSNINTQPLINKALKPNVGASKTTSKVYTDMQPPKSQIVASKKNEKLGFRDNMSKIYTRIVDSSNPIKKADMNTYVKATNAKSTGGIVDYVLKNGLVDSKGNKIGKSLREVVEVVPKGKENEFWDYMLHRNNIDRAREGKAVYTDYTSEMSAEASRRFETAFPQYKQIGDDIVNWIDNFTRTWGVDAGTVNKEMYDNLKGIYKSYIPTNRDFSTLEDGIPQGVRSKFVDQKSPIKKATGSDRDIVNPVENIMNLVNRTIRTAKYNEVGQTLLDTVRKNPEKMKQFAEEIPIKDGMFANTDNIVTVLENGKPVYLKINNIDLLQSLNAVPKQINNIKYLSSVMNLYKGLITQKNPIFAIRNIFRDIPTAYVYGSEKNPVKFGADLLKASKQAVTNGEMLQKYKSVGGGGANFFNSGNVTKSASEISKKGSLNPIRAIEKFNNLTETAPRLAEFTRVYEKTGDINKALYAANDVTVNFSRGGDITKTLDKGVPYLNAGVQGLDKFFREAKNNPLQVLAKAGVSITAPTVGLYLINKDNPNYQQLDNRTKDSYYLIPNILDKDENGNAKTFIKIPKSRELGVLFSALFERSVRAFKGEDKSFKGFANTVATNFSPTNPVENNIFSPLAYNIPTNKDFAGRTIVPQGMVMDNRSPYLQYDEKTSEIAKKIGELTKDVNGGLSPKQVDYIMRSYLGIIAQYGLPLNTKGSDPLKALTTQFKADPVYSNQTLTDFYDNLDKLKRAAADKNITQKIPSKLLTPEEKIKNTLNKASLKISDINKEIRKFDQVNDKAKIEELRRKILKIANDANNMIK